MKSYLCTVSNEDNMISLTEEQQPQLSGHLLKKNFTGPIVKLLF